MRVFFPPLTAVIEHPVHQSPLEANVVAFLLGFKPFVPENLVPLREVTLIQRGFLQQCVVRSCLFVNHSVSEKPTTSRGWRNPISSLDLAKSVATAGANGDAPPPMLNGKIDLRSDTITQPDEGMREAMARAVAARRQPATLRLQPGYDHSYFFVSSFMDDHIAFHAEALYKD